jgi:hypothetical protein
MKLSPLLSPLFEIVKNIMLLHCYDRFFAFPLLERERFIILYPYI